MASGCSGADTGGGAGAGTGTAAAPGAAGPAAATGAGAAPPPRTAAATSADTAAETATAPDCAATAEVAPATLWRIVLAGRTAAPKQSGRFPFQIEGEPVLVDEHTVAFYDQGLSKLIAFDERGRETWSWALPRLKGSADLPRGPHAVGGTGDGTVLAWWTDESATGGTGTVAARAPDGTVTSAAVPAVRAGKARLLFPAAGRALLDPGLATEAPLALTLTPLAATVAPDAPRPGGHELPLAHAAHLLFDPAWPGACTGAPGGARAAAAVDARGCVIATLTAGCPGREVTAFRGAGPLVLAAVPELDASGGAAAAQVFVWRLPAAAL